MNIREFEYIVAIADEGNISKAARLLNISQPSLSNFLKQEEYRLGHKLFSYNNKNMIPTKAGKIYLEFCRKIIDTKKQTYSMIFAQQKAMEESFTVGFTPHRGAKVFASIYPKFISKYPNINIKVEEGYVGDLKDKLLSKEIDIVIGTVGDIHFNQFNVITDSKESLKLCVPKFHPTSQFLTNSYQSTKPVDINIFNDTPFINWGRKSTLSHIINDYFKNIDIKPTITYESNNVALIDSMLHSGIGIGFMPTIYCTECSTRSYFDTDPPLYVYNGIISRKNEELTKAQKYLTYLIIMSEKSSSYTKYYNENTKKILSEFGEKIE